MRYRYQPLVQLSLLLPLTWAIAAGGTAWAQATPGINPDADTPTEDLDGLDNAASDIDEIIGDVDDSIGDVTNDIEAAVSDTTEGIQDQIDEALGDSGIDGVADTVEAVTDSVGGITDTFGSVTDIIDGLGEQLSDIFSIFDQFGLPDFGNIFSNPIEILTGSGDGDSSGGAGGSIAEGSPGVLGLPDPSVVEENINQSGTSPTEEALATTTGGDGSEAIKLDAKTAFDADLAEEVARESALTQEGQERIAKNLAVIDQALEESEARAEDSRNQDVSQNILRNISIQAEQRQVTDSLLATDAQLRQRDDALRNIVIANNLRQNKETRVAERRQDASAYNFAITHGGLIALPNLGADE